MRPSKLRLPLRIALATRLPVLHRSRDRLRDRTAIADTGRASVADQVEAQLLEVLGETRALQIVRDDLRSGREAGLDPRLDREAALDRLLREQSRGHHHRRIRGVGATRNRRDHQRAVSERKFRAVHLDRNRMRDRTKVGCRNPLMRRHARLPPSAIHPCRSVGSTPS